MFHTLMELSPYDEQNLIREWMEHGRSNADPLLDEEDTQSDTPISSWLVTVDVSYAAPQAHGIVNVALHREYSPSTVFIFSQGRKDLYHV
jgi:hypothetical protein